jgi:hypothetical protein
MAGTYLKQLEILINICQCRSEPDSFAGWLKTGPIPPARVTDQPNSANPMIGPTTALPMKSQRSLWIGTQIVGRDSSQ